MAAEKKQITRTRISYSCVTCRRRKVKCDKVHPKCGGCQRAGEECTWTDADKPTRAKSSDLVDDEQQRDGDSSRKRRAVEFCQDDDNESEEVASVAISTIEKKMEQLNGLIKDLRRLTPVSNSSSPVGSGGLPFTRATVSARRDSSGAGIDDVLRKLEQLNDLLASGGKPRARSIDHERDSRPQYATQQSLSVTSHDSGGHEQADKSCDPSSLTFSPGNDALAPIGEEANAMFRSWLFSTYPVLPIFPPQEVFRKWQVFYNWYRLGMDKGEPNPDPSFMPFLKLLWYCAYHGLSNRAKEKWFPWAHSAELRTHNLRVQVDIALDVRKIESMPSIWSLGASVMYQHLGMDGQDMISCSIRNMANVRMAQSLGLHTEKTMKSLTAVDAEIRRRLWWEVIAADAALASVSGMPVIMDDMYTDTRMMSELKETVLGTSEAEEYKKHIEEDGAEEDRPDDPASIQTSSLVSVYHLVAQARHMLTIVTKRILKTNMRAQPMTMPELKEVRKALHGVSSKVLDIINRIPTRGVPEHGFTPDTTPQADFDQMDCMGAEVTECEIDYFTRTGSDPRGFQEILIQHRRATIAFHKWARIMLSLLIDRVECISYAPFLKNSKSRLWATSRNCALKGCHGFMRKYLSLREDPELRYFRPVWYSACHPMHATIIMLIDVHDRPHTAEASRSRAMIDKVLSFSAPENRGLLVADLEKLQVPFKEGGREAWTMLRKLRHKAWQKAGLDPDVLWTEEDQMAVGVGKPLSENDLFVRELREDILCRHSQIQHRKTIERISKERQVKPPGRILMHPSELGPGDQVSGSITKAIEDLGHYSEMPRILLLRAHHEQELMPYPIQPSEKTTFFHASRCLSRPVDANTLATSNESPSRELHIGELIRKIRQSQASTTPTHNTITSSSESAPSQTSPEDARCDFRAVRDTTNAAYQDILENHSDSPVPGPPLAIGSDIPSMRANNTANDVVNSDDFSNLPVPHNSTFNSSGINNHSAHSTAVPHQGAFEPEITIDPSYPPTSGGTLLPQFANTPSSIDLPIIQQPQKADSPHIPSLRGMYSYYQPTQQPTPPSQLRTQPQSNSDTQLDLPQSAPDMNLPIVDTRMSSDIDFDWDKWDEMFGQFAGFEDMLLDIGREEENGAAAETDQVKA